MFLGLQIEFLKDGSFFIYHSSYAKRVLARLNMEKANSVVIPADTNNKVYTEYIQYIIENNVTNTPYREAIGSFMYLSTGTRPDITFVVNCPSRYIEKPAKLHWNAVKRILKYIKGRHNLGLIFRATGDISCMLTVILTMLER